VQIGVTSEAASYSGAKNFFIQEKHNVTPFRWRRISGGSLMLDDGEICIDETMTVDEIDALGLTVRQIERAFDDGSLCHLSYSQVLDLFSKASERFIASLSSMYA
jgi:hypothetical protein